MQTVRFYLEQSVLLGTVAYGLLVVASRLIKGPDVSVSAVVDTAMGLLASWVFVLAFLVLVATPVQLAVRRFRRDRAREVVAGGLSGLVAGTLLVVVGSYNPFDLRALLILVPLALVGAWFSFSLRRHLGRT